MSVIVPTKSDGSCCLRALKKITKPTHFYTALLLILRAIVDFPHRRFLAGVSCAIALILVYLFFIDRTFLLTIALPGMTAVHDTVCPDVYKRPPFGIKKPSAFFFPSVYEYPKLRKSPDPSRPIRIPHIIHQTYKTRSVPTFAVKYIRSWRRHHPNWIYVFWTDSDIDQFIRHFYPAYIDVFEALPASYRNSRMGPVYRADLVRYLILDFFGGVYADLDTESVRSLDQLTRDHAAVISREPEPFAVSAGRNTIVQACNAFMMSTPGHPLWFTVLETIVDKMQLTPKDPVQVSGPVTLDQALRRYHCRKPWTHQFETTVFLAPSPMFYSYMPWMDEEVRKNAIAHMCIWLRFFGAMIGPVEKICYTIETEHRIDWSSLPSIKPEEKFVLHQSARTYDTDRFKTTTNKNIDVSKIIPDVIDYRELLKKISNPRNLSVAYKPPSFI